MPGLTIQTDPALARSRPGANPAPPPQTQQTQRPQRPTTPRAASPTRPPVSPITPTLGPAQLPANPQPGIPDFALGRPVFTHTQPDQVGMAPPPAAPISFDDNPDVLALKSAISILQLQRARATADMQALGRAKAAALADPAAFVTDLAAGRVGVEGDPLVFPETAGEMASDDESSSSGSGSESESASESGSEGEGDDDGDTAMRDSADSSDGVRKLSPLLKKARGRDKEVETAPGRKGRRKGKQKQNNAPAHAPAPAWGRLPKPQTVVRCPPINWAQYGVVGESLDKLHAEQVAAPTPGVPRVLGPGGAYEFKAGEQVSSEPGRRLVGIAAPYVPGKDRIEKKTKGKR